MIAVLHGLATLLLIGSAVGLLLGYVWMLVAAYRASLGWLLVVLLFSGIGVPLFLIAHWDEAKGAFFVLLASGAMIFMGLMIGDRADHMQRVRQEREAIMNGQE